MILNKAYIGQTSCFKIQLTPKKEAYLHTGRKEGERWIWEKAKFNDLELTQLHTFLENTEKTIKFFHNYEKSSKQIYFNRDDKGIIFPIINKLSGKALTKDESKNLRILLPRVIQEMSFTCSQTF